MPISLSVLDRLRIFEIIEYRHISANEKVELLTEMAKIRKTITYSTGSSKGRAKSSDSTNFVLSTVAVAALGLLTFYGVKKYSE